MESNVKQGTTSIKHGSSFNPPHSPNTFTKEPARHVISSPLWKHCSKAKSGVNHSPHDRVAEIGQEIKLGISSLAPTLACSHSAAHVFHNRPQGFELLLGFAFLGG